MWPTLASYALAALGAGGSACGIIEFFRRRDAKRERIVDEVEIIRAARDLLQIHGSDASHQAATRALFLFDQRDINGFYAWKRIAQMIEMQNANKDKLRATADKLQLSKPARKTPAY